MFKITKIVKDVHGRESKITVTHDEDRVHLEKTSEDEQILELTLVEAEVIWNLLNIVRGGNQF